MDTDPKIVNQTFQSGVADHPGETEFDTMLSTAEDREELSQAVRSAELCEHHNKNFNAHLLSKHQIRIETTPSCGRRECKYTLGCLSDLTTGHSR